MKRTITAIITGILMAGCGNNPMAPTIQSTTQSPECINYTYTEDFESFYDGPFDPKSAPTGNWSVDNAVFVEHGFAHSGDKAVKLCQAESGSCDLKLSLSNCSKADLEFWYSNNSTFTGSIAGICKDGNRIVTFIDDNISLKAVYIDEKSAETCIKLPSLNYFKVQGWNKVKITVDLSKHIFSISLNNVSAKECSGKKLDKKLALANAIDFPGYVSQMEATPSQRSCIDDINVTEN